MGVFEMIVGRAFESFIEPNLGYICLGIVVLIVGIYLIYRHLKND